MISDKAPTGNILVPVDALGSVAHRLLVAEGTPDDIAAEVARHLVTADASGHASHGMIHLPRYLEQVESGEIRADARPRVSSEAPSSALLDGEWGFGHFAAKEAARLAVEKANSGGVAAIALVRTGHIGRLGEFTSYAAEHGCAMLMATAPIPGDQVVPPGGAEGVLGTNPLAIGFPDGRDDPFCLDFATSAISGGKVWLAQQRGDEIPDDVLLTPDLVPTRDPSWLQKGAVFPAFGGHKGYALSLAIALLAGALTGGGGAGERPVQAGTLFIALRGDLFTERATVVRIADDELTRITSSRTARPGDEILVPGEPEARARASARARGVEVTEPTRIALVTIAERLGVDPGPLVSQS